MCSVLRLLLFGCCLHWLYWTLLFKRGVPCTQWLEYTVDGWVVNSPMRHRQRLEVHVCCPGELTHCEPSSLLHLWVNVFRSGSNPPKKDRLLLLLHDPSYPPPICATWGSNQIYPVSN